MSANETTPDPLEIIDPAAEVKFYTFGPNDEVTYAQKPLGFFGKMELFSVLGGAIEKALTADVSVSDLFDSTTRGRNLTAADLRDADQFMKVLARLAIFAPEILADVFCVSLAVPRGQREYVKALMDLPEDDGGITDKEAIQVIDTFVAQNWDVMVDFFKEQILPLAGRIGEKISPESPSSKPSKATQRTTGKK